MKPRTKVLTKIAGVASIVVGNLAIVFGSIIIAIALAGLLLPKFLYEVEALLTNGLSTWAHGGDFMSVQLPIILAGLGYAACGAVLCVFGKKLCAFAGLLNDEYKSKKIAIIVFAAVIMVLAVVSFYFLINGAMTKISILCHAVLLSSLIVFLAIFVLIVLDMILVAMNKYPDIEDEEEPEEEQPEEAEEEESEEEQPEEETEEVVEEEAEEEIEEETEEEAEEDEDDDDDEEEDASEDGNDDNSLDAPEIKRERRVRRSFATKLAEADEQTKNNISEIQYEFLRYRRVRSRMSQSGLSFRLGRELIGKATLAGKTLKLHLKLNCEDYPTTRFHQKDLSHKKVYERIPFTFKVKSPVTLKRAKILIGELMEKEGTKVKRGF